MSQKRQLAAIMFTDIEGYTSLMGKDEKKTISFREKHRQIFESITKKYNGDIIQYFGDGTLSAFKSTVEAVDCAIEMQLAFMEEPTIPVRIGVHVGDIMYSKDDIVGDAVNVASRIESCAIPGSILISDKVHDQIRSHRHIHSEFLDAYELKNIEEAIPIFAIANPGLIVPKREEVRGKLKENKEGKNSRKSYKYTALALGAVLLLLAAVWAYFEFNKSTDIAPLDYSIAVLPFANFSNDESFEIFTDGMTEDILTNLSKLKDLHVISRTSVMQYKKTDKTIPEIAKELGVAYILEGSIRKEDDKIRVAAQLIKANGDGHIWAENYDKTLTDIFGIQSEVSQEIVNALQLNLSFEEQQNFSRIATQNIDAYELFLKGRKEADKRNKRSLAASISLYKEAISLDPNYVEAYAEIANSVFLETYYIGRDPEEGIKTANEYLDQAEMISDKVARTHSVRGIVYTVERKNELAKKEFEKAIELSPNDLTTRHQFSTYYYYNKDLENQLEQAKIAYSLDPLAFATANSYFNALVGNQKYVEAEKLITKIESTGEDLNKHIINVSFFRLYMEQDRCKEAIVRLKEMVIEQKAFNRFLGHCYAKTGDTINAYKTIDVIRKTAREREKSHQLAMVYAGLQEVDSTLYYLDTIRHKQTRTFSRERKDFFEFLKDDPRFHEVLKAHGIKEEE